MQNRSTNKDLGQFYAEYWDAFVKFLAAEKIGAFSRKPRGNSLIDTLTTPSGIYLQLILQREGGTIAVHVASTHKKLARRYYEALKRSEEFMDRELGFKTKWDDEDLYFYIDHEVDLNDRSAWGTQHRWLAETAVKMRRVAGPVAKKLIVIEPES